MLNFIEKDSISIDFQGSFEKDSIYLYVDNQLIFKGGINTNPITGFACSVKIKKPKDKNYSIKIKTLQCTSKEQIIDSNWKFVGISYPSSNCYFEYLFSETPFEYY